MNLSEALDAALPEMPKARYARERLPRLDPELIVHEDTLDGEPIIGILQRDKGSYFRLSPGQWRLAELFDGFRTYEEVAAVYNEEVGGQVTPEEVRKFADSVEEVGLWYKSPQEKNLALSEKLMAQRSRRAQKTSSVNIAHIYFSAWDPDRYLTWLERRIGGFIYSYWCVLAVVLLFCFEASVFISKWNVIGPDVPLYFNFTHKNFGDLVEFWLLLMVMGFIHESAHGLTCKHFGGEVHNMGLMFLYLVPCFFVDVTESWVSATRVQRLATIIAGIWIELVICGVAMVVWLNTPQGQWLNELTYKVILLTGVAVIVLNVNPLLKIDGYYFLTEAIGIPDLKERSTEFVSGWFQHHILRLPVEVISIPRRRTPLFVLYALASGAYSYLLLFAFIRFTYNVTSHWLAEFAVIPAGWLAFTMFRSRLRSLRDMVVRVWKDNSGVVFRWRPVPFVIAAGLLAILFVPLWRDRENAFFVVGPGRSAAVHAAVDGRVESVFVSEGQQIRAGQPLLRMTSTNAASMRSGAEAETSGADARDFEAELHGQSIGAAAAGQAAEAARATGIAQEAQSSLLLAAPADGVVLTDDPAALLQQDVGSGQLLLTLADDGPRSVRVFVPASALDRIPPDAEVALALPGHFALLRMELTPMEGETVDLPAGLVARQDYKGLQLPTFYFARLSLPASAGNLPLGLSGTAKIFGKRRSLAERLYTVGMNLLRAHVW
jgi:putative peptide zinc metalloprotease protein